ncbi:MAG: hypothetical protein J0G29_02065 [Alphaproteobacteria bacterium]|nr:hypothetical protein [Alphaproteobacteria bacterium]OJV45226.1 MAG: hypothetical protein BGO28_00275 [Alphaproteobacteria bacterium 43-37]
MSRVDLSKEIINEAQRYANINKRSLQEQIEYWYKVGKMSEENPDLSYKYIKEILLCLEEEKEGKATPYTFDS